MELFNFKSGNLPLLVSMPHSGTFVPDNIKCHMTEEALKLPDTDWHIPNVYQFLEPMDVSVIQANYSRYVVDLNRPSDNASLYPGQDVPGICALDTFDKKAIYQNSYQLSQDEIHQRIEAYWRPYHDKLRLTLDNLVEKHGYALLWDAHSIKSHVPRFFENQLPDLNLGTADNKSCHPDLGQQLIQQASKAEQYTSILNGRFKGGYITRHYGVPSKSTYAVQLELSQATYMNEDYPFEYNQEKAKKIAPVIQNLIKTYLSFKPNH